jgi:hypothetical protein
LAGPNSPPPRRGIGPRAPRRGSRGRFRSSRRENQGFLRVPTSARMTAPRHFRGPSPFRLPSESDSARCPQLPEKRKSRWNAGLRMARPGLEPGTPRFSGVLPLRLNPGELQGFPPVVERSGASGFSRTLRTFSRRYGRRWGPSAFSLRLASARPASASAPPATDTIARDSLSCAHWAGWIAQGGLPRGKESLADRLWTLVARPWRALRGSKMIIPWPQ